MNKSIEVIILTYNRSDYLKQQLISVCQQTLENFYITVLNNASTDNTLDVIKDIKKQYQNRKIKVITNEKNIGNFGNFLKAQKIASKEYVCILHDDDILHPYYLEKCNKIINDNKDIVLISGNNQYFVNPSNFDFQLPCDDYIVYSADVCPIMQLSQIRFTFQCSVYKTEIFKKTKMRQEEDGKMWDINFLLDTSKYGNSAFLLMQCMKVRYHNGQDSNTYVNGPFVQELLNILKHQSELLKQSMWLRVICLYKFASTIYTWSKIKDLSKKDFLKLLKKENIVSRNEAFFYKHFRFIVKKLSKLERMYIIKNNKLPKNLMDLLINMLRKKGK